MKPSTPHIRFAPALLLGLALGGCLVGKSTIGLLDDDGSSDPSSGDATSSNATSGNATSDGGSTAASAEYDGHATEPSSGGSGNETPRACPPESSCSQPAVCAPEGTVPCGGVLAEVNADGCPRLSCSGPGECPTGTSCYLPHSWGMCGPHGCYDNEETGACECTFGLDCNNDGLCVPDEEGLPPDTTATDYCGQHTDATSCDTAPLPSELGACHWYEGWQMPVGVCEERVEVGRCTFHAANTGPSPIPPCPEDASLSPVAYVDDGSVTVLFVDPEEAPTALEIDFDIDSYGWFWCDAPEVSTECACACG